MITPIDKRQIENIYPMSPAQMGMYLHYLLNKETNMYVQLKAFTLKGHVDHIIIERAIEVIVKRHSILRTIFVSKNNRFLQIVLRESKLDYSFRDISRENDPDTLIKEYFEEEQGRGFDMAAAPPIKIRVFQLTGTAMSLVFKSHHIVLDGWSMSILENELAQIYLKLLHGEDVPLTNVPQFGSYIEWIDKQNLNLTRSFWNSYLEGYKPAIGLSGLRETLATTGEIKTFTFEVDEAVTSALKAVAARLRSTFNIIFQLAWSLLLSRVYRTNDLVVGVVTSGRPQVIENVDSMVGMFISIVPFRVLYDPETRFSDLAKGATEFISSSQGHQYLSFSEVQESIESQIGIRHLFTFDNSRIRTGGTDYGDLSIENRDNFTRNSSDFNVIVGSSDFTRVIIKYNTTKYDTGFVKGLAVPLQGLIRQIISDPDVRVSGMALDANTGDRSVLRGARFVIPDKSVIDLFEEQVALNPTGLAVVSGQRRITYEALSQYSNTLAGELIQKYHVGYNTTVGVYMAPGEFLIVAFLGILKAGAAFLPLDVNAPEDLKRFIIKDADINILITTADFLYELSFYNDALLALDVELEGFNNAEPRIRNFDDSKNAYLIYTSGSTGTPKGVQIPDRALLNYIHWFKNTFTLGKDDSSILLTSHAFDLGYTAIWGSLVSGATLHMSARNYSHETDALIDYMIVNQISFLKLTPSLLYMILNAPSFERKALELKLKLVLIGGESIRTNDIRKLQESIPNVRMVNHYGPSEATIGCIIKSVSNLDQFCAQPTIGKPIQNNDVFLVDDNNSIVPNGFVGEICISGPSLSSGYVNQSMNRDRFFENHFSEISSTRFYKTGDLACVNPSGDIVFLGRKDSQVKIRGYRVEIQDVEARLNKIRAVRNSSVIVKSDSEGFNFLVAFVELLEASELESVKAESAANMPEYMVPSHVVFVDKLPVTKNGKADKKKLYEYDCLKDIDEKTHESSDPIEVQLISIMNQVLNTTSIHRNSNFLKAGGNSLKAVQLASIISHQLNISLQIQEIFDHSIVQQLAECIRGKNKVVYEEMKTAAVKEYYNLLPVQESLWMHDQMNAERNVYNVSKLYVVNGKIDVDKLNKAFRIFVSRHEILRTTFVQVDGVPKMVVNEMMAYKNHTFVQVEDLSLEDDNEALGMQLANSLMQENFNLLALPLFKVQLFKISPEKHYLVFVIHHILSDEQSQSIILKEVSDIYKLLVTGKDISPEGTLQFKDFVEWSRGKSSFRADRSEAYWTKRLNDTPGHLQWPFGEKVTAMETSICTVQLNSDLSDRIRQMAIRNSVSVANIMITAYFLLLNKITGANDIIVMTPVSLRSHLQAENMIGPLINTLPVRIVVDDHSTFRSVLADVHKRTLEALEYSACRINDRRLVKTSSGRPSTISNVGFTWHSKIRIDISDLPFELVPQNKDVFKSKADLWMHALDDAGNFFVNLEYRVEIFGMVIQRIADCFEQIVYLLCADEYATLSEVSLPTDFLLKENNASTR